jgi:hypothetical protein
MHEYLKTCHELALAKAGTASSTAFECELAQPNEASG